MRPPPPTQVLVHVADISNPCKPWAVGKAWSDRVLDEFFAQGDSEKRQLLPVTPNMDRDTTRQTELSVNFVDFIVGPFFMALTGLLPKVPSARLVVCVCVCLRLVGAALGARSLEPWSAHRSLAARSRRCTSAVS